MTDTERAEREKRYDEILAMVCEVLPAMVAQLRGETVSQDIRDKLSARLIVELTPAQIEEIASNLPPERREQFKLLYNKMLDECAKQKKGT